jgi:beta-phosphoglucomutase-like phosphatase (HAD superfamily)
MDFPHAAALIFDCDGTLADTMPAHYRAWTATLDRYGIPFSEARFYQLGGVPSERIIRLLSAETGIAIADVSRVAAEKEAAFLPFVTSVLPLAPVVALAQANRGRRPQAVASGGYRNVVTQVLQHLHIADWFGAIVTAEDTERHKPDPDVFLEAARRLNVPAAGCVVFEDTDIGLEAARRAGMVGVDVRPMIEDWRLLSSG